MNEMDTEQLFLGTILDLERLLESADEYAMLRASALLRQLLMDESPVLHQVNRPYRKKLRFPVCGAKYTELLLELDPEFYSALDGIHRSGGMVNQLEELSLDAFLSSKVLKLGDNILTIGNLISISANILGGVHKGVARKAPEKAVEEFNRHVSIYGHPVSAAQMKPVILVAIEGMAPVIQAIRAKSG